MRHEVRHRYTRLRLNSWFWIKTDRRCCSGRAVRDHEFGLAGQKFGRWNVEQACEGGFDLGLCAPAGRFAFHHRVEM
jgi:hypothetical protein